jgi:hypothetical protein
VSATVTAFPFRPSSDGQRALRALDRAERLGRVAPSDAETAADLACRGYPIGLAVRVAFTPPIARQPRRRRMTPDAPTTD